MEAAAAGVHPCPALKNLPEKCVPPTFSAGIPAGSAVHYFIIATKEYIGMNMTEDEVTEQLLREIRIITGGHAETDPDRSLADNGINSMGFMELLLAIESRFGVPLAERGVHAADTASVRALAHRIVSERENA